MWPGSPIIPQSGIPGRAPRERSGRRQRETARSRRRGRNQRAQGAVRSGAMDQAAFQTRVRVQGRPCRRPVRLFRRARLPSQVEGSTCGTGSSARVQLSTHTDGHGMRMVCRMFARVQPGCVACRTWGKFEKSSLARTVLHPHACKRQPIGDGRKGQYREQLEHICGQCFRYSLRVYGLVL